MRIAKIVTIVKIPFVTAGIGKNKMTGNHALILRNDLPNDKNRISFRNQRTRTGPEQSNFENL